LHYNLHITLFLKLKLLLYYKEFLIMLTKDELPACPVATMVELIGNKWKLLIIRNLLASTCRFGELKKGVPGISQKVLTDNLRALEADGLIIRTVYPEVPPKVEYSLSGLGNTLRPLFKDMEVWGNSYKKYVSNQEFSDC
jgi:DNA-binding HxlR family transcriptional regulator